MQLIVRRNNFFYEYCTILCSMPMQYKLDTQRHSLVYSTIFFPCIHIFIIEHHLRCTEEFRFSLWLANSIHTSDLILRNAWLHFNNKNKKLTIQWKESKENKNALREIKHRTKTDYCFIYILRLRRRNKMSEISFERCEDTNECYLRCLYAFGYFFYFSCNVTWM